jgi:hypothetical protein
MTNTITDLMPKILAQGLLSLREMLVYPRLVNTNYSNDAKAVGDRIVIPTGSAVSSGAVTPANVPPDPGNSTMSSVEIVLSSWERGAFGLTTKQMNEIDLNQSFLPIQTSGAMRAIAGSVNAAIAARTALDFGGYAGTAGTTPFASDTTAITATKKVLQKRLCPLDDGMLSFVLDPDANEKALNLTAFSNAQSAASTDTIQRGNIGHKYGFDFSTTTTVPSHTAGTITTGLIAKASTAVAAGLKTFTATTAASTGACALLAGDVITIGTGSTARTYALAADVTQATAATDIAVTITEPLDVALVGSEAITVKATHVVNSAFHRDAIGLAVRSSATTDMQSNKKVLTIVDDMTGLPLTLKVYEQYEQWVWEFFILYGVKTVRPQWGARLAG